MKIMAEKNEKLFWLMGLFPLKTAVVRSRDMWYQRDQSQGATYTYVHWLFLPRITLQVLRREFFLFDK